MMNTSKMDMTRFQLMVPVPNQKPPNFKVVKGVVKKVPNT